MLAALHDLDAVASTCAALGCAGFDALVADWHRRAADTKALVVRMATAAVSVAASSATLDELNGLVQQWATLPLMAVEVIGAQAAAAGVPVRSDRGGGGGGGGGGGAVAGVRQSAAVPHRAPQHHTACGRATCRLQRNVAGSAKQNGNGQFCCAACMHGTGHGAECTRAVAPPPPSWSECVPPSASTTTATPTALAAVRPHTVAMMSWFVMVRSSPLFAHLHGANVGAGGGGATPGGAGPQVAFEELLAGYFRDWRSLYLRIDTGQISFGELDRVSTSLTKNDLLLLVRTASIGNPGAWETFRVNTGGANWVAEQGKALRQCVLCRHLNPAMPYPIPFPYPLQTPLRTLCYPYIPSVDPTLSRF
jgi:hypothetical protein